MSVTNRAARLLLNCLAASLVLPLGCSKGTQGHLERGDANFAAGKAEEAIDDSAAQSRPIPPSRRPMWDAVAPMRRTANSKKHCSTSSAVAGQFPDSSLLQRYRGLALLETNKPHDAVESLTRALELEPDNTFALRTRALAFELLNDIPSAIDDLNRAIAVDSDNHDLYVDRAGMYLQSNHLERTWRTPTARSTSTPSSLRPMLSAALFIWRSATSPPARTTASALAFGPFHPPHASQRRHEIHASSRSRIAPFRLRHGVGLLNRAFGSGVHPSLCSAVRRLGPGSSGGRTGSRAR